MDVIDRSTPEAVAASMRAAMVNGDWAGAFSCVSLEKQTALVGGMGLSAAYAADAFQQSHPALIEVLKKNGVESKEDKLEKSTPVLLALLIDLLDWSENHLPAEKKLDLAAQAEKTAYSEFRTRDDRAYAIATCDGRRSEVRFQQVDGLWIMI